MPGHGRLKEVEITMKNSFLSRTKFSVSLGLFFRSFCFLLLLLRDIISMGHQVLSVYFFIAMDFSFDLQRQMAGKVNLCNL